jgi:alkylation response protein AidB-like acyl-CoA dehydrogenase
VGQLETAHFRASAALEFGIQRVTEAADPVAGLVAAITLKDAATEAAVEVVDLAVQIVGGAAYFKRSPLERLVRDVRAARHHPPCAPVSSQMIGRHVLTMAG